jgi:hypothetical protein
VKIFASLDNSPKFWLKVKNKIYYPEAGNTIKVRSDVEWLEPTKWTTVEVIRVWHEDGQTMYDLRSK